MAYSIINREAGKFTVNDSGGNPKTITQLVINDEFGAPKLVKRLWINDGGVWRSVAWRNQNVLLTVTGDHTNLDIYQAVKDDSLVDHTAPLDLEVVINNSRIVSSTSRDGLSLWMSQAFVTGSFLKITNRGVICGAGGKGAGYSGGGIAGVAGGTAMSIKMDITLDNSTGYIYGGGGGGASQKVYIVTNAGGGGQGQVGGAAGVTFVPPAQVAATAGTYLAPGKGGKETTNNLYGGDGGTWGEAGDPPSQSIIGAAGAGGKSILYNGHTITWLGGDNETHVKGDRVLT